MAATGQHEHWSSRFGFLMASIGFAVGLGNIWRFPYMTGEHGGAAFVLVYLICAFVIGVPILMAEVMIGRRGGMSPPGSMREVAKQEGATHAWRFAGVMNLVTAFTILITYCVVAGWVLTYLGKAVTTGFAGADAASAQFTFQTVVGDVWGMLFWTLLVLAITGFIVYRGVKDGIEKAVIILMPTLFALLVALVVYNAFAGGFAQAADYLFSADFSKIDGSVWLAAIGQAFFSVGVAMAGMMTFGAYLPKEVSIVRSAVIIVIADTIVALLAGFAIFPAVFANGLDPEGGPGLIFKTLPVAFAQMPGGHMVSVAFFLLLSVAAITSMVGLLEPLISWAEEHRGISRHKSAVVFSALTGVISILTILAYSGVMTWELMNKNFADLMDYLSCQLLLPLGGLLIAIFAGWSVSRQSSRDELQIGNTLIYDVWRFAIRFIAPVAVLLIMLNGVVE